MKVSNLMLFASLIALISFVIYYFTVDRIESSILHDEHLFQKFHQTFSSLKNGKGGEKRIAIIGAGIGGASVAYFLNTLFPTRKSNPEESQKIAYPNLKITLFEKAPRAGGRTYHEKIHGVVQDLGATSIIKGNYYAMHLVQRYNLTLHHYPSLSVVINNTSPEDWNLRFLEPESKLQLFINIIKTYGTSFFKIWLHVRNMISNFKATYLMQNDFLTWNDASSWLEQIELKDMSLHSFYEYFIQGANPEGKKQLISEQILFDFLQPIFHVNYMQNGSFINAFAGCVGLAPLAEPFYIILESAQSFALKMIEDCQKNLQNESFEIRLNSRVSVIEKIKSKREDQDTRYKITYIKDSKSIQDPVLYDELVIAAPLEFDKIEFKGFGEEIPYFLDSKFKKDYIKIYANVVVASRINWNSKYLKNIIKEKDSETYEILFTDIQQFPLSAMIMRLHNVKQNPPKYTFKMFSFVDIPEKRLKEIFEDVELVRKWYWIDGAYTALHPRNVSSNLPFQLDEHLYYQNALEYVVSTMETQMIASKNTALMIAKSWYDEKK